MIIQIAPDETVEVPTGTDFRVRVASSFSLGELAEVGTQVALEYMGPDGVRSEVAGDSEDTDLVFEIPSSLLAVGRYVINPRAYVSGKTRRWPEPAFLIAKDPLTVSFGSC